MTTEQVASGTGQDGPARTPDQATLLSEALFRTVFEQSPISTQIFAPDGTAVAVNRAWERLWGVTLDQIAGYNVLHDHQLVDRGIMPYIERGFAGEAMQIPAIRYEPSETIPGVSAVPYRWVAAAIYPVKDPEGVIRQVVLMHDDITERVEAEQALRESEARFRAIFEGAPVGISLLDNEGRFVSVNRSRQEMLGYSEDELIGRHYLELTHPDDVAYDLEVNARARQNSDDHFQLEKRFRRKDGSLGWTRVTVSLLHGEHGEPLGSIAISEDITDRKAVEEERVQLYLLERIARENLEKLAAERAAILGQIADGIVIADPAGHITFVNDAAQAILGVGELGVPIERHSEVYNLFTLDGRPYPPDELPLVRAVVRGETVEDEKVLVRRPDGTEVITQATATPVMADDNTRLGAVLTLRDVTAQLTLERQKDDFLSAAAHDLRTPLTTIKGRVELLRRRAERDTLDQQRLLDDLERIEAGAARMVTLINELLDVANIQIGRPVRLTRRPVDLVLLARRIVEDHQQAAGAHRMRFEAAVPELLGVWDATRLERVLANLLSNAIKYSPDGGEIVVRVGWDDDGWAQLTVSDQGIGIPEADLAHIFDRFHRGANVAGSIPGTGIGLAAVREIVEQHRGTVSVVSREGEGTTFIVRLPHEATP